MKIFLNGPYVDKAKSKVQQIEWSLNNSNNAAAKN